MNNDHDGPLRFRTIWISDLHLGSSACQAPSCLPQCKPNRPRRRRKRTEMEGALDHLMGQNVEVVYEGIVYRGLLVGTSETEIHLQTINEWVSLPLDGVASVKKAER